MSPIFASWCAAPTLRELGGWPELFDSQSCARIDTCGQHSQRAQSLYGRARLAISPIPYGYLARRIAGLWRVGDQAAVIPSFTGDGISIALHSARSRRARCTWPAKAPPITISALRAHLRRGMALATWLSARRDQHAAAAALCPRCYSFLIACDGSPLRRASRNSLLAGDDAFRSIRAGVEWSRSRRARIMPHQRGRIVDSAGFRREPGSVLIRLEHRCHASPRAMPRSPRGSGRRPRDGRNKSAARQI